MHYLRHVMLQETEVNRQTRYRLPQSTSVSVGEEQVAKWHFNQLDQNHNGVSFSSATIDNTQGRRKVWKSGVARTTGWG